MEIKCHGQALEIYLLFRFGFNCLPRFPCTLAFVELVPLVPLFLFSESARWSACCLVRDCMLSSRVVKGVAMLGSHSAAG